jgi:hypothetical protein
VVDWNFEEFVGEVLQDECLDVFLGVGWNLVLLVVQLIIRRFPEVLFLLDFLAFAFAL